MGKVKDEGELRRMLRLWRAFRREQADPETFYRLLAAGTVEQLGRYCALDGAVLVDVGGASGYLADAARSAGASAFTAEPSTQEASQHGRRFGEGLRSDGCSLALRDASADVVCCTNVAEHVARPKDLLAELVRITRPGGVIFVSFTTWYGPWGGHETSPWHYLGGERAARRYERKHGRPPKNRYGSTLFRLTVGEALRYLGELGELGAAQTLLVWPRYYPSWCSWVVRVPVLREVLTWNLAALLRRS